MPIISVTGVVGFCGKTVDNAGKEYENITLYIEQESVSILEEAVARIRKVEKHAKSLIYPMTKVSDRTGNSKRQDCKLIDFPESYTHFINIKNAIGFSQYLALDLSNLEITNFKTGDEIKAQINMFVGTHGSSKFASMRQMKVLKMVSQKYKGRFISEVEEKLADEDFFKGIPKADEVVL